MKLPQLPGDRQISDGGSLTEGFWLFFDGISRWIRRNQWSLQLQQSTQAKLSDLAKKLTKDDAGLLVEVIDYAHILRWTGSGWEWGPSETGGGYFGMFAVTPGTGWHSCDGSVVNYLKSDGTAGTVTLPNLVGTGAYPKAAATTASYTGVIVAGTPPTISAPNFTGTPVTPTGTVGAISASVAAAMQIGTGSPVAAASLHTHPAPTFTGNPLTPSGTVDAPIATLPDDPVHKIVMGMYFRQ